MPWSFRVARSVSTKAVAELHAKRPSYCHGTRANYLFIVAEFRAKCSAYCRGNAYLCPGTSALPFCIDESRQIEKRKQHQLENFPTPIEENCPLSRKNREPESK